MAKGYIFTGDLKLRQATHKLQKAAAAFNQTIESAVQRGKLPAEIAPKPVDVKTLIDAIPKTVRKDIAARELERQAKQLESVSKRGALSVVKLEGGAEVTRYELRQAEKAAKEARKKRAKDAEKEAKRMEKSAQIRGHKLDLPKGEPFPLPDVTKAKTTQDFRKFARRLEFESDRFEWQSYQSDLLKNIDEHYSGSARQKLYDYIARLTPEQLESLYYGGAAIANQDFHYEDDIADYVNAMIDEANDYLNTGSLGG